MLTFTLRNQDQIPALGLGTWKSAPGEVYQALREALRIGYRHIDCAAVYGNEAEIGQAFQDAFAAGEVRREELWVTSKLWNNAHRREDVRPALEKTLKDLQLEYLDLYLMHWPIAVKAGIGFPQKPEDYWSLEEVPLSETWTALEDCVDAGLCRHIGVSNFSISKLEKLLPETRLQPEVNQIELQPYLAQNKMLEFCRKNHIHLTAYSPLGSKDRPARVLQANDPVLMDDPVILEVAATHLCTPAQVLIRWAIQRGTSVIPKSVNPERLRLNFEAQNLELSEEAMQKLAALDKHYRFINGRFWEAVGGVYTLANIWDEAADA